MVFPIFQKNISNILEGNESDYKSNLLFGLTRKAKL